MINWKYIAIAIAVIAAIVVGILLIKRKSISFDFDLGGNVSDLLGLIQGRMANPGNEKLGLTLDIPLTTNIKNGRKKSMVLDSIVGSISYNGMPVLQTNPASTALKNVNVPGKSITPVTDNVQLLINESTIKLLTELIKGKKVDVQTNFSTIIAGKPYSINKTSTINKS